MRLHADNPSYRELEERARRRKASFSRSTLGEVLSGKRFPSKAFLLTFVQICGVDAGEDERWETAWKRLAPRYLREGRPPDFGQDQETKEGANPNLSDVNDNEIRQIKDGLSEMADRLAEVHEANLDLTLRVSLLTSRVKNLANAGHAEYKEGDVTLTHEVMHVPPGGITADLFIKIRISYSWYCSRCKIGGDAPEVNSCPWCATPTNSRVSEYNVRLPAGIKAMQRVRLKGIGMCSSEGRGPGAVYVVLLEEPPF